MPDFRSDKRIAQLEGYEDGQVKKLSDEIKKLKAPDPETKAAKKLGPEEVKRLIELYENSAIEIKLSYDKKKKQKAHAENDKKMMKKLSKDYIALKRYQQRIEIDPKEAKWTIDDFFENSKTKTIKMSQAQFAALDKAGAGQSTRYKVGFNIDDEPVEGRKKGDYVVGYFTPGQKKDPSKRRGDLISDKVVEHSYRISEKYPGAADFISDMRDEWNAFRGKEAEELYNMMRSEPEAFGTRYSMEESKKMIADGIRKVQQAKSPGNQGIRMGNIMASTVERIKTPEEFYAYTEYVSSMLKEDFAMGVKESLGIDLHTDSGERNAMTSVMADVFGCSNAFAFSEKMKLEVKDGTNTRKMKGTVMMQAKGADPMTESSVSDYSNLSKINYEGSKDAVKAIAQIQFLDYILGNPDRHAGNLFLVIDDKTKKVVDAQAIDNDTCAGKKFYANKEMSGVDFSKLRVIPKSMADAVTNMKPEMFEVLMQGYDITDEEIKTQVTVFKDLQKKLKQIEKAYEGTDPRYIDPNIPRIVPDEDMGKFYVKEQLAFNDSKAVTHSNLFGKLTGYSDRQNKNDAIINDRKKCERIASEIGKTMNIELKNNIDKLQEYDIVVKERKPNEKSKPNKRKVSHNVRDAYKKMVESYEKLTDNKYEIGRIVTPEIDQESKYMKYSLSNNMSAVKEDYIKDINAALEANENYIEMLKEDMFRRDEIAKKKEEISKKTKGNKKLSSEDNKYSSLHANKYEDYMTSKAFLDYYEKNNLKSDEPDSDYQKELANFKKLKEDPDVMMVDAAVKTRELLMRSLDNFEKLENSMGTLKKGIEEFNKMPSVGEYGTGDFGKKAEAETMALGSENEKKMKRNEARDLDVIQGAPQKGAAQANRKIGRK